ncbi:MAG: hypothetical protein ABIJ82_02210 [Patescibacteria group bacterium]|nr:hypothetical protein [Patescibacteria group bacterium]MBU1952852.1 hypothetical protein [Patescibacteria group bacterium]
MEKKVNLVYSVAFLVIPLLLTGIIYGELLIWGYYGPIAFGLTLLISFLVFLAAMVIAIGVWSLTRLSEEYGKVTKSARFFTNASTILGVLAILQFVPMILRGIWLLFGLFFS